MTPAILVPLIVFGSVVAIVKMALDYSKWKQQNTVDTADQTLRTSELRAMIEDAVTDATAELTERVERLERQLPERPRRRELPLTEEEQHASSS